MITPSTDAAAVRCGGKAVVSCLRRSALIGAAVLWLCGPVRAEDADEEPEPVILGIMLADAPLTLVQGLAETEKALAEHPQSRAVSVIPELRDGQPRATVKLLRPTDLVTVTERLN
jgi:hypothetical protein